MRYTTVIDLTDMPALYRNHNIRLVYLHMVLKCGYHDSDRDLLDTSVRRLSADVGITVSAVRHALHIMEAAHLIERQGTMWAVKKWIPTETISKRTPEEAHKKPSDAVAERERIQRQRDDEKALRDRQIAELEAQGKTSFMVWYESMVEKAKTGDIEAQRSVERNRKTYEAHAAQFNQTKGTKK